MVFRNILTPFEFLYSRMMAIRNHLYDSQHLKSVHTGVPVVSVGNITLGGTGKTPLICELVAWAIENQLKPGVVSRGYRGQVRGVARVKPDGDPAYFGDEPVLIAQRFNGAPVYVGADRVAAVKKIREDNDVNIVFADDAFQHRRMLRDIDIVIFDCTEDLANYRVVPVGRARESLSALTRAQFVILNKVNLTTPEHKRDVLEFIEDHLRGRDVPIIESEYYVRRLIHISDSQAIEPIGYESAIIMSGVGNPKGVEKLLIKNFDIKKHLTFRDHHEFNLADVKTAIDTAKAAGAKKILVTEKDAVKIKKILANNLALPGSDLFWSTELSLKLSIKVKRLYEKILALTR